MTNFLSESIENLFSNVRLKKKKSQWLFQFQKTKLKDLNNNVEITEIQPATIVSF